MGRLGAVSEARWGRLGTSWRVLGASWGVLRASSAVSRPSWPPKTFRKINPKSISKSIRKAIGNRSYLGRIWRRRWGGAGGPWGLQGGHWGPLGTPRGALEALEDSKGSLGGPWGVQGREGWGLLGTRTGAPGGPLGAPRGPCCLYTCAVLTRQRVQAKKK